MPKYYESDITLMFRELLEKEPHIADEQKKGRSQWWDKTLDRDTLGRMALSKVPHQPYAYQKTPSKDG
jgi:hypothetical protein